MNVRFLPTFAKVYAFHKPVISVVINCLNVMTFF